MPRAYSSQIRPSTIRIARRRIASVVGQPLDDAERALDIADIGSIDRLASRIRDAAAFARGWKGPASCCAFGCCPRPVGEQHVVDAFRERGEFGAVGFLDLKPLASSSALTWPGCGDSTRMREPTMMASSIEWVTNSTVKRISSHSTSSSSCISPPRQRVERGERLVHQQDLRLHRHARGRSRRAASCRPTACADRRRRTGQLDLVDHRDRALVAPRATRTCRSPASGTRRSAARFSTAAAGRIPGTPSSGRAPAR